ncbi:MAG: integrin alpha, partial [Chitinophagales bacterium]
MKKLFLISAWISAVVFIVIGIIGSRTNLSSTAIKNTSVVFDYATWEEQVFENIANAEYIFRPSAKNTFEATNRQNGARFFVSPQGFTTQNRKSGNDKIQFSVSSIQSGQVTFKPDEAPEILNEGQILSYINDDYTIEYINAPEGLRQNFIIHQPEKNSTEVTVRLQLDDAYTHAIENNKLIISKDGTEMMHYGDLRAFDATGTELYSEMILRENTLELAVNTSYAVFPVLIDPVSTTPDWSTEANQAGANMGFAVSTAGDVNNDGYDDVVVGAAAFDAGEMDEGKAYLFLGSASGLSPTAVWEDEGDNVGGLMGKSVAAAGDVNGDGYDDLLIGLGLYSGGQSQEGRAHIYYGNSTGVSATPDWFYEADQAGAGLGFPLEGLGDVNGDGFDDIIIGANGFDAGQVDEGRAYVFYGSASGLASTPDWQV